MEEELALVKCKLEAVDLGRASAELDQSMIEDA